MAFVIKRHGSLLSKAAVVDYVAKQVPILLPTIHLKGWKGVERGSNSGMLKFGKEISIMVPALSVVCTVVVQPYLYLKGSVV